MSLQCVCSFTAVRTTPHYNKQKFWQVKNNRSQLCVYSRTLCCHRRELAFFRNSAAACVRQDRTEKTSCQSVRATVIPESRREASIRTTDKQARMDQHYCGSWAQPQEMPFLASSPGTQEILRGSLNSRLIKCPDTS